MSWYEIMVEVIAAKVSVKVLPIIFAKVSV